MTTNTIFSSTRFARNAIGIGTAVGLLIGCATQAPEPAQPTISKTPSSSQASRPTPPAVASSPSPRVLAEWKRSAAERIHTANRPLVFTGTPPNPLRAVVVVEMTVSADGQVRRAELLRVPGHAKHLGAVALKALNTASPLPAPPRMLVAQGPIRTTETWLFRDDGQFQIRTLALPQSAE
jgi:protein TonB